MHQGNHVDDRVQEQTAPAPRPWRESLRRLVRLYGRRFRVEALTEYDPAVARWRTTYQVCRSEGNRYPLGSGATAADAIERAIGRLDDMKRAAAVNREHYRRKAVTA